MIGRTLGALLVAAVALLGVGSFAQSARADFVYDLSVAGPDAIYWTGSGGIAFNTLSGNTPAGVTAFAFHVSTGSGASQDYVLADIDFVQWSIDASMNLSLLLTTSLIPFGPDLTSILLTNQPGNHDIQCFNFSVTATGSLSCQAFENGGAAVSFDSTLTASLVPIAIPEPATMALFCAGLICLVMVRRRKVA